MACTVAQLIEDLIALRRKELEECMVLVEVDGRGRTIKGIRLDTARLPNGSLMEIVSIVGHDDYSEKALDG